MDLNEIIAAVLRGDTSPQEALLSINVGGFVDVPGAKKKKKRKCTKTESTYRGGDYSTLMYLFGNPLSAKDGLNDLSQLEYDVWYAEEAHGGIVFVSFPMRFANALHVAYKEKPAEFRKHGFCAPYEDDGMWHVKAHAGNDEIASRYAYSVIGAVNSSLIRTTKRTLTKSPPSTVQKQGN